MKKQQWIMRFALMHKWAFLFGFIIVTVMTLVNMIYPFLNGKIINIVFYDKDMSAFLRLCSIYIIILLFNQFIVTTINNLVASHLATGFVFDIRRTLFKKILHKKGEDLSGMYSGDMISRMNNDTSDFMNYIFWSGLWGYSNALHITFAVFFLFYYNIFLGISTVILVPIVYFTSRYFKNKMQKVNADILPKQGKLSSYLFEIVKNMHVIKILNACKSVKRYYLKKTTSINKMIVQSGRIEVTAERVNSFISLGAQLAIFIVCAYFIAEDQMQLGVFVAARSYFSMAVNYFSSINGKIVDMGKQNIAIQRVVDILNEEEEDYRDNLPDRQIKDGVIEFRNVTFAYPEDNRILKGVNLHIDAASTVGVVGKSGAGKTTIANLLCGLYNVGGGSLFIDGQNVNEYNLHNLRSQVGIVHQEPILYDGTLRYNLSFSNEKDNDDVLIEAIKKAAFYDVLLTLSNGLDTLLGTYGQELSGGQKQRLAIARILVKNPKILIFDEATSALDSQNEEFIRNVLSDLSGNRTLIIIAHRFSTIRSCDKIAVLSNGIIDGFDTHDNLMKNNETYINLFSEQCIAGEAI